MKRFLLAAALMLPLPAHALDGIFRPITSFRASISATEITATKLLSDQTTVARVLCTVTCHVAFPVSPVQTALTVPTTLIPHQKEYFRVTRGLAVHVKADAAGVIYVTEME